MRRGLTAGGGMVLGMIVGNFDQLGRGDDHRAEDDAIVLTMNAEAMEMGIRPAEGNLEGEMKIGDGMIRADEESAPNQRANATQPDMQPIDFEGRHSTPRAMREPTNNCRPSAPGLPGLLLTQQYQRPSVPIQLILCRPRSFRVSYKAT